MIERQGVLRIECDECDKVENFYLEVGTPMLPDGWIQINEGAPFHKNYDFCGPTCFMAWHKGPKEQRIKKVYTKERERSNSLRARQLARSTPGPRMYKLKAILFEEDPDGTPGPADKSDDGRPAGGDPSTVVPARKPRNRDRSKGRNDQPVDGREAGEGRRGRKA